MKDLYGVIFAYRSDGALRELVSSRTTASVPFGGRYRLIIFTLSSMVNAGAEDISVIMRESYQSLLDHLGSGKDWGLSRRIGGLKLLPPFGYTSGIGGEYRGDMEALWGVHSNIRQIRQRWVVLATGDLAANLDLRELLRRHVESGADITAAAAEDEGGGVRFAADADGRVTDVICDPRPGSGRGLRALGVYILSSELLLRLMDDCHEHNLYRFSSDVLGRLKDELDVRVCVHGGYFALINSVADYFRASRDLLLPEVRADLFDPSRPIKTKEHSDPSTAFAATARVKNSLVSDGCLIEGRVEDSILFRGVRVAKGAEVKNCVLMQGTSVGEGSTLGCVIADKGVRVSPNLTLLGHDRYPLVVAKGSEL